MSTAPLPLASSVGNAAAAPSMVVARGFQADAAHAGLQSPLPLLGGGEVLLPTGAPMSIGLDHRADMLRAVAHACRCQAVAGRDWYAHGAVALVGAEGAGRGHAARRLAAATGLPLLVIDVSTPNGMRLLVGVAESGCAAALPFAVSAIAATRCANPLILVEGLSDDPATSRLIERFVDPLQSRQFASNELGATFDLSQVNWMLQFATDAVPRLLPTGSMTIVPFPRPNGDEAVRMQLLSMAAAVPVDPVAATAIAEMATAVTPPPALAAVEVADRLRLGSPLAGWRA